MFTFKASSSKLFRTFSWVLALHSRYKQPSSFARAAPSSLLTNLSESWNITSEYFNIRNFTNFQINPPTINPYNLHVKRNWKNVGAYFVYFISNKHLDTVLISGVEFHFFSPYFGYIREALSLCNIIHCNVMFNSYHNISLVEHTIKGITTVVTWVCETSKIPTTAFLFRVTKYT